jgi:hypothetical protein
MTTHARTHAFPHTQCTQPENIFIAFEDEEPEEEAAAEEEEESGAHESAGHASRRRRSKRLDDSGDADMTPSTPGRSSASAARNGSSPRRKRKVRLVLGDMGFARQVPAPSPLGWWPVCSFLGLPATQTFVWSSLAPYI